MDLGEEGVNITCERWRENWIGQGKYGLSEIDLEEEGVNIICERWSESWMVQR